MIIEIWLFAALAALGILIYALNARTDELSLIASASGLFVWLVVAFGALNIETFSRQQDQYIHQEEPALAILAVIGALLCLVNALYIAFDWARDESEM